MTLWRFRSLQVSLIVQLGALYIVGSSIIVGVLIFRARETANSLNNHELIYRAQDLTNSVAVDGFGALRINLSAKLAAEYAEAGDNDVFAIRAPDGSVIAASPASFGDRVATWPVAGGEAYFRLGDPGASAKHYYGLTIVAKTAAGSLSVSVARAAASKTLIYSWLWTFVSDISWIIALFMLVTLAMGSVVIRRGLRPVKQVSRIAEAIGPDSTSVRLPNDHVPSEITPLVVAMNKALERLEQGFATQRQFTANAAHQLRTPLAIITCALDDLESTADVVKLRRDVARMNRLVEQLLKVSRLDSIALDTVGKIDLGNAAMSVVAMMAPLVVSQNRAIDFALPDQPVCIRGNAFAIEDAIRNLIENALIHSSAGTKVIVNVRDDKTVHVIDSGPGIPSEDREHLFKRFWRGKNCVGEGAGLGLAIVSDIMKLHGGTARIADNPSGGAVFILSFASA